jgi:IS1 family transposase
VLVPGRLKIINRLQRWDVSLYCTDESNVYRARIPAKRWAMHKGATKAIGRHHAPNRHWFTRFKRKICGRLA